MSRRLAAIVVAAAAAALSAWHAEIDVYVEPYLHSAVAGVCGGVHQLSCMAVIVRRWGGYFKALLLQTDGTPRTDGLANILGVPIVVYHFDSKFNWTMGFFIGRRTQTLYPWLSSKSLLG